MSSESTIRFPLAILFNLRTGWYEVLANPSICSHVEEIIQPFAIEWKRKPPVDNPVNELAVLVTSIPERMPSTIEEKLLGCISVILNKLAKTSSPYLEESLGEEDGRACGILVTEQETFDKLQDLLRHIVTTLPS